jgi:hypothetical protein
MIESAWMPRGLVLSDRDVTPTPSARSRLTDTPAMSSSDITTFRGPFHSALHWMGSTPTEHWIARQLRALLDLPPNWDTYGARPISDLAAEDARLLILQLLDQGVAPPVLVPLPDGGVSVEWHRPSRELAIEFPGATGLLGATAYYRDDGQGTEWEDALAAAVPRVLEILSELVVERR